MNTPKIQTITRFASFVAASLVVVGLIAAIPAAGNIPSAAGIAEREVVGMQAGAEEPLVPMAPTSSDPEPLKPTGEGTPETSDDGQIIWAAWYSPHFGVCWLNCWDLWFDCDCYVIEF